jgi:hypothetical protein
MRLDSLSRKTGTDFTSIVFSCTRYVVHYVLPVLILLALRRHLSPFFLRASAVVVVGMLVYFRFRRSDWRRLTHAVPVLLAAFALIAFVDVVWHLHNTGRMQVYPDALNGYIPLSEKSIWGWEFWFFDIKPFVTPLLFKIAGRDIALLNDIFVVGYLLVTVGFLLLLRLVFEDRTERLLSFYLLVLLFLNQSLIGAWLTVAQSEVPAIVTTIAMLAVYGYGFALRERLLLSSWKRHAYTAVVVVSTVAFSFSRDTNLYFVPVLVLFYAWTLRDRRQRIVVATALASLFVLHNATMNASGRWKFPLTNVVLQRVLPDPELRAHFQESYGLPVDALLASGVDRRASEDFENKELLVDFGDGGEDWVSTRGLEAYKHFLLTNPTFVVSRWYARWNAYNADFFRWTLRRRTRFKLHPVLFSFPGAISFFGGVLVLTGSMFFVRDCPLVSLAALHAFTIGVVAYHGDSMEVERHMQQAAMTLRVAFVLLLPLLLRAVRAYLSSAREADLIS